MKARLFWVVYSPDDDEEIFQTEQEATKYAQKFGKEAPYTISIAEVSNYFKEADGSWNYDDQADTFKDIVTITYQTDTRKESYEDN